MTDSLSSKWPTKRLRFATMRTLSPDRRQALAATDQVTFLPMEAIGEQGEIDFLRTRDIAEVQSGYTLMFDGDVIVAKITPCFENGKGALVQGLLNGIGYGTTELHVLTPGPELHPRFLYYVTVSEPFRKQGEAHMIGAAGQKRVSEDFVRDFPLPLPPLPQQRAIAAYLDRETAHIDALIAAKQRLLALLAEKRRAVITQAVTRGLDPSAPLRESGVEWLGQIPAHWKLAGFNKYLKSLVDYRGRTPEKTASGVFLVTARNIRDGYIDYEASQEFVEPETYEEVMQRGKARIGNVLLTTEAPLGQAALVDREDIALAQRVIKLDYDPEVLLNEYALAWIRSTPFQWQLYSYATGSTALGIKAERLHLLRNLLPPVAEQRAIVAHIAAETGKLDALAAAAGRTIALLKERRAALIAAAVTGEIVIGRMGQ